MQIQTPLESEIFSSVGDLPLHPLVVHVAVVLLPLAALVMLVAAFVPAVRRRFLGLSVIGALIGAAAAFVSKESGESLADVVGEPEAHEAWADRLMVVTVIFVVVAVLWWLLARRRDAAARTAANGSTPRSGGLAAVVGLVTAALAVAVIVLSVLTGHSGAQAAWGDTLASGSSTGQSDSGQDSDGDDEAAPAAANPSSTASDAQSTSYTMADVEKHDSASSCWAVVDGGVYDLTDWIAQHPGGQDAIQGLCGTDGSGQFDGQHGNNNEAKSKLAEHRIGSLSS